MARGKAKQEINCSGFIQGKMSRKIDEGRSEGNVVYKNNDQHGR